jgi:hypothetical protein
VAPEHAGLMRTFMLAVPATCAEWRAVCRQRISAQISFKWYCPPLERASRVLGQFKSVNTLSLGAASRDLLAHISIHLSSLSVLDLSESDCTDAALTWVASACQHSLASLRLACCADLTDYGLASLSRCSSITTLDLSAVRITDTGLKSVASLPLLTWLSLAACDEVTDEGVCCLADGCPHLRTLILDCCLHVTDEALEKLALGCPQLETLDLDGCVFVTDDGLGKLVSRCLRLCELTLEGCLGVTDASRRDVALLLAGRGDMQP